MGEKFIIILFLILGLNAPANSFTRFYHGRHKSFKSVEIDSIVTCKSLQNENGMDTKTSSSTYENSDASSKGVVSSLTNFVNFVMGNDSKEISFKEDEIPPVSPNELLEKIKEDYVDRNYLWTGDIHIPAFEKDCRFTDPTLSFTGRDQFVSNVQNLRPILDALMESTDDPNGISCKSNLLEISLNEDEGFVQSRWNMVGKLGRLPWKPKIDVIGKTKFWYREVDKIEDSEENSTKGFRVYFYDEAWEIPAGEALLQLITPDASKTL